MHERVSKFTSDFLYMFEAKVLTYHKTFDKQIKTGNLVIKKKWGMWDEVSLRPSVLLCQGVQIQCYKTLGI